MRWTHFVRHLGGIVILDIAWEQAATAEFPDDGDGALNVVCHLDDDGDLDVGRRPKLEGEKIREHAKATQAMAAFAYVNPGSAGDGETVSREAHAGAWQAIDNELVVAQAKDGAVGGVEVGGRGPFLVLKGRLWLPYGPQEAIDAPNAGTDSDKSEKSPHSASQAPPETKAAPRAREAANEGDTGAQAPQEGNSDRRDPSEPPAAVREHRPRGAPRASTGDQRRPRRSSIFGDEADDLINQARSASRGRRA